VWFCSRGVCTTYDLHYTRIFSSYRTENRVCFDLKDRSLFGGHVTWRTWIYFVAKMQRFSVRPPGLNGRYDKRGSLIWWSDAGPSLVTDGTGITRIVFHCAEASMDSHLPCSVYRSACNLQRLITSFNADSTVSTESGFPGLERLYRDGMMRANMNQQGTQCTYNVTLRRFRESLLLWKSNKYYVFVCPGAWAWAWACACVHVTLLI
jgi:hypothetical protein